MIELDILGILHVPDLSSCRIGCCCYSGRDAKYCSKHVCMSVLSYIWKPHSAHPNFAKFSVHVNCGCGSVLWRQCSMLCTSSFVDEVMFAHNRRGSGDASRAYTKGDNTDSIPQPIWHMLKVGACLTCFAICVFVRMILVVLSWLLSITCWNPFRGYHNTGFYCKVWLCSCNKR